MHAALGVILAAAVLGPAFDRRTAVVAALAGAAPDLDAVIGLLAVPGGLPVPESTHGAVLHSVFLPGLAAFAVYVDARRGRRFRGRYGSAGVRLAWVAVLVYAVVGIGLDLFNIAAANPLWPLHDMFYGIIGQIQFTNQELFVQTYVRFDVDGHAVYVGQQGDTGSRFLRSPFNPTRGPDVRRRGFGLAVARAGQRAGHRVDRRPLRRAGGRDGRGCGRRDGRRRLRPRDRGGARADRRLTGDRRGSGQR